MRSFGLFLVSCLAAAAEGAADEPHLETICSIVEVLAEVRASFEEWQKNDTSTMKTLEDSFGKDKFKNEQGLKHITDKLEESKSDLDAVDTEAQDLLVQLDSGKKALTAIKVEITDLRDRLRKKRQDYRAKQSLAQRATQVTSVALSERMQTTQFQDQSLMQLGSLNQQLRGRPVRGHHRRSLAFQEMPAGGMSLLAEQAPQAAQAQSNALKAEEGNEEIRMEKLIEEKQKDAEAAQSEIERIGSEYAESQEKYALLQRDISSMDRSSTRDQAIIEASKTETDMRTKDLEEHIAARAGIIANLGTAVGTLQGSGCKAEASLIETSASLDVERRAPAPSPSLAAGVVSWGSRPAEREQRGDFPLAFVQFSSATDVVEAEDPFAGVKAHIQEMVSALKAKINGDMDHADWCTDEKKKNEAEGAAKQVDIDSAEADVREKKMQLAKLEDQISFASSEVARLEASAADQGEKMKLESSKNAAMLKEHSLADQCLDQSVDILRKYYNLEAAPAPQATGEAKTGQSLVDTLLQTKTMTSSLTETVTKDAQVLDTFFKKVAQDTEDLKKLELKERDDLMGSQAEVADGITQGEKDFKKMTEELALVADYKEQLQEECGPQKVDLEERKKRRAEEIQALQDALKVMEGEALPSVGGAALLEMPQPDKLQSLLNMAQMDTTDSGTGNQLAQLLRAQMMPGASQMMQGSAPDDAALLGSMSFQ